MWQKRDQKAVIGVSSGCSTQALAFLAHSRAMELELERFNEQIAAYKNSAISSLNMTKRNTGNI